MLRGAWECEFGVQRLSLILQHRLRPATYLVLSTSTIDTALGNEHGLFWSAEYFESEELGRRAPESTPHRTRYAQVSKDASVCSGGIEVC